MKNANGSVEEPLALLAFRQNQSYRTVVRLRIDFDEISLRFSQSAFQNIWRKSGYDFFKKGEKLLVEFQKNDIIFLGKNTGHHEKNRNAILQ